MTTKTKGKPRVDTSADTASAKSHKDRATKVAQVSPKSALRKAQPQVGVAIDTYVTEVDPLVVAYDQVTKDEAQAAKSRSAYLTLLASVNGTYGIAVATLEKYGTTSADITENGFDELKRAKYSLVAPLDLTMDYDRTTELLGLKVKQPPGGRAYHVELSPGPLGPTMTWTRLDGIAAEYHLPGYAPGTWWGRARTVRGTEVSDWVGPVAVVIR